MTENSKRQRPTKAVRRDASEVERLLWTRLRRRQLDDAKFRRLHPIHDVIATFACLDRKTVVEFDLSGIALAQETSHETRRLHRIESLGWKIILVKYEDVFKDLDAVAAAITAALPPATRPNLEKPAVVEDVSEDTGPDDTGWQP